MNSKFHLPSALIPSDVRAIVQALKPARSYVVGGVVREIALELLQGRQLTSQQLSQRDWDLATASRPEQTLKRLRRKGFAVLPRRWVVERTFGWFGRSRRLSKDYEQLPETSEAMIYAAMSRLMVKRLAQQPAIWV